MNNQQEQHSERYNQGFDFGFEEGYEGENLSWKLPDFSGWSQQEIDDFNQGRVDGDVQGASDC